jgi:hypothetical protein
MLHLYINMQGDGCWPDLVAKANDGRLIDLMNTKGEIRLAVLDAGMQSGSPSVSIRIDLPDGKTVVTETSAKLFVTAARMIQAKYPHLLD